MRRWEWFNGSERYLVVRSWLIHAINVLRRPFGDDERYSVFGFQDDFAGWGEHGLRRIRNRKPELAHQIGQDDFDFQNAVLLPCRTNSLIIRQFSQLFLNDWNKNWCTDAIAGSGAEWDEGVRMSAEAVLRKESFRLECIRIGINQRTVVHAVNHQGHRDASG